MEKGGKIHSNKYVELHLITRKSGIKEKKTVKLWFNKDYKRVDLVTKTNTPSSRYIYIYMYFSCEYFQNDSRTLYYDFTKKYRIRQPAKI